MLERSIFFFIDSGASETKSSFYSRLLKGLFQLTYGMVATLIPLNGTHVHFIPFYEAYHVMLIAYRHVGREPVFLAESVFIFCRR